MNEPLDLATAIDALADALDGVRRATVGVGTAYERGGVEFAVVEGSAASFRLRRDIAAAALKTPDTSASTRGADWVTLEPSVLDEFSLDRALAWFESAWRLAGEPPVPRARPH